MKIYQVDTFVTGKRFSGNPAGVCILEKPAAETWMQGVAGEMNLAETAFLLKNEDAFELRWFTPVKEVDLCGHATLASAHILWEFGFLKRNEKARFNTKSGLLSAKSLGAGKIELDFPEEIAEECPLPETVKNALEIEALWCGKNRMDYLIEAPSEEILMNLKPDFKLLTEVPCRGFLVTSKSNSSRFDFVSRCFFPWYGIDEDPFTGSAHCCLGPFWRRKLGRDKLAALQASKRGGAAIIEFDGNRVLLTGSAVTVFEGELMI